MGISNTEKIGFANQLIQMMKDNAAKLKDGGLNVENWITEVTEQRDGAVLEGSKQDEMQAAAKIQTKKSNNSHTELYQNCSTKLDAMCGVFGKTSEEAKQAGKLRSSINKQTKPKKPSNP